MVILFKDMHTFMADRIQVLAYKKQDYLLCLLCGCMWISESTPPPCVSVGNCESQPQSGRDLLLLICSFSKHLFNTSCDLCTRRDSRYNDLQSKASLELFRRQLHTPCKECQCERQAGCRKLVEERMSHITEVVAAQLQTASPQRQKRVWSQYSLPREARNSNVGVKTRFLNNS